MNKTFSELIKKITCVSCNLTYNGNKFIKAGWVVCPKCQEKEKKVPDKVMK